MLYAPQHTDAGHALRQMRRPAWRALSRAERIVARETAKATMDMMIFGTGYTRQGDLGAWRRDGSDILRHVPAESVWSEMDRKES